MRKLWWFAAIIIVPAALAILGGIAWHHAESADAIADKLETARPWLVAWRIAVFVSIVALWPRIVSWLSARKDWTVTQERAARAQRWRVAAWLAVLELLLGQNLLHRFLALLGDAPW